ncbi:MAG: hypothetical protein ACRYG5_01920 [Janthinobacterium lividum]
MPRANTRIEAQAQVSYLGARSAERISLRSNVVETVILPVEALVLRGPTSARVTLAGQAVVPVTLVNTGNTASTYALTLQADRGVVPGSLLLYRDTASSGRYTGQNGAALPVNSKAGAALRLEAGEQLALLAVFDASADAPDNIVIRLHATTTEQSAHAEIRVQVGVVTGAALQLSSSAQPGATRPGGAIQIKLRGENTGRETALPVAAVDAKPITIDGVASHLLLLRHEIPNGSRYVGASISANSPTVQRLVRTVADRPFAYRSAGREGTQQVVEVAFGLIDGLAAHQTLNGEFGLRVDNDFSAPTLNSVAETIYTDAPDGTPVRLLSNTSRVVVGALDPPDLTPELTPDDDFVVGGTAGYTMRVRNTGLGVSSAEIVSVVTLPPGMDAPRIEAASTWQCTITAPQLRCRTNEVVAPGAATSPVRIIATLSERILPACQASVSIRATQHVSGGGEPAAASANNTQTLDMLVSRGAVLSGRAWIDTAHDGRYRSGAKVLRGWRAQLLYGSPDGASGYTVVHEALTDAQGVYRLAGVMPGRAYALRIVSPTGALYGTPRDNSDSVDATHQARADDRPATPTASRRAQAASGSASESVDAAESDTRRGVLHYRRIRAGHAYRHQDLALVPSGVVYDAATREPIAGARITLKPENGSIDFARDVLGGSSAGMVSDEAGFYFLNLTPDAPAGIYTIDVEAAGYRSGSSIEIPAQAGAAHAPPGIDLAVAPHASAPALGETPRWYKSFAYAAGAGRLINNHIPLDQQSSGQFALTLTHQPDRPTAELIDFVNYTLILKHRLNGNLPGFRIDDELPAGFNYESGSARLAVGGRSLPAPEPTINRRHLTFHFDHTPLPNGQEATLRFRARVGATAREGTRAESHASAMSGVLRSNPANASVQIVAGVFSSDAFVAGKVFLDCHRNGEQDADDPGVPGVRIYLEDGTYAETDVDGKYSLYGLKPLTHVLKLDATTLPVGTEPLVISSRNAGNGNSRFLDLRNGELGRGDFALSCSDDARRQVLVRRAQLGDRQEIDGIAQRRMDAQLETGSYGNVKSRPATGIVDPENGMSPVSRPVPGTTPSAASATSAISASVPVAASVTPSDVLEPLDALLPKLDNSVGFVDLTDAQRTSSRQTTVRVKGHSGGRFTLTVNGTAVSDVAIGQRSEQTSRGIAAWSFIGVRLAAGANDLSVVEHDSAGRPLGEKSIRIMAPGDLANIEISTDEHAVADGKTPIPVQISLRDANGTPVTARIPVTITSSAGAWEGEDHVTGEASIQRLVDGGSARFVLLPPSQPQPLLIRVRSGMLSAEQRLTLTPELRPMIAAGIVEGSISLRNGSVEAVDRRDNGFERQLSQLSRSWGNGASAGARTAFFLKGKVKGSYLLTAAFDSEKDSRERLFRDIEPDRYYPVYGDASVRGFDAQSTGRLYVRIDSHRSYLIYGDFSTSSQRDRRQLTQYDRAITGLSHHYEGERLESNVFINRDSLSQRVVNLPARGFGPYELGGEFVENSEHVEVVTYDRDQKGLLLKPPRSLERFADYSIEPMSGHLLLNEPLLSIDPETNGLNYLRISYETEGNGDKFWLFGGDAQFRVTDNLTLGAVAVEDRNPNDGRSLRGVTAQAQLGSHTDVTAEYARTDSVKRGDGEGARIALKHQSERLKADVEVARTSDDFDNISSPVGAGRLEVRGKAEYQINERDQLKTEALHTRDNAPDGGEAITVTGASASLQRPLNDMLSLEVGSRVAKGTVHDADDSAQIDLVTGRARLTSVVPGLPKARVYGEYEQDVRDMDKRAFSVGGDYQLGDQSRVYARHELISSLGGLYEMNGSQRTFRSLAGIDTSYSRTGHVFSEYRQGGAIGGRDAQAAFGLRDGWEIAPGLRLGSVFERTRALRGGRRGGGDSTSLAGSLEYLGAKNWKGSTLMELRKSSNEDSVLQSAGIAYKLSQNWTALVKSTTYRVWGRGERTRGDSLRTRQRAGVAYRQTARNTMNALAYYEHRLETGRTLVENVGRRQVHMMSAVANAQPLRHTTLSARYAAKYVAEHYVDQSAGATAQLVFGRISRDIGERWDVGMAASTFFDNQGQTRYAFGGEVGYRMKKDLWVSLGYNLVGYHDRDFSSIVDTTQGPYFRLRFKFDETSFGGLL